MTRPVRASRADFRRFLTIPTRWADNDVYGHVNNVVYLNWFDTAVNRFLLDEGLLDIANSPVISIVVETGCTYFESVAYPEAVDVGIVCEKTGTSSIVYRVGVFRQGADLAAAQGRFVHVTVERAAQTPVPMPAIYREKLALIEGGTGA